METVANNIMAGLTQSANILVNRMKQKLGMGYPKAISDAISISNPVQEGEGRYSITVSVDLGTAPMAAAFEFGSGLHAEIGDQKTYQIPNEKTGVAFPIDRWPKYNGPSRKYFYFTFVNHPGIAARPYMRPSVVETTPEVVKILGDKFKTSILIGIREVWNNGIYS